MDKLLAKEKMKPVYITAAFWAIVFFGPFALFLWNAFSPAQYRPGELGYVAFRTVSQGVACGLAVYAANTISDGNHKNAVLVNTVVGCTVIGMLALLSALRGEAMLNTISMAISFAVLLVNCIKIVKRKEE